MDPVDRVKNMVRHALVASPSVTNRELYDRAKEIAPGVVDNLSLKQFHARFRLPITRFEIGARRKPKPATPRASSAPSGSAPAAERRRVGSTRKTRKPRRTAGAAIESNIIAAPDVRDVLVDFAVALEQAGTRSELIQVMAKIDTYVQRILDLGVEQTPSVEHHENGAPTSPVDVEPTEQPVATEPVATEPAATEPAAPPEPASSGPAPVERWISERGRLPA